MSTLLTLFRYFKSRPPDALHSLPDLLQKGGTTTDSGVNTDTDWESQVASVFHQNSILKEQYDDLMKKQEEANEQSSKELQELLDKKEAAKQQHKARLYLTFFRFVQNLNNWALVQRRGLSPSDPYCSFRHSCKSWSLCE